MNSPSTARRTIGVTGASGYIGSHVALALLREGYEVKALDNETNSFGSEVIGVVRQLSNDGAIEYRCGDIRSRDDVNWLVDGVDVVVHMAAFKSVPHSVTHPLMAYDNNVTGTLGLLQAMKDAEVSKMVFSSSATVYGTGGDKPATEDSPIYAINPYGWSKVHVEQYLADLRKSGDMASVSLRYFNPLGCDPSGLLKERPKGESTGIMGALWRALDGQPLTINVGQETRDGSGERDYVHVSEIAGAHVKAVNYVLDQGLEAAPAINLATGRSTTTLELAAIWEKVTGRTFEIKQLPPRAGDAASVQADISKSRDLLGWSADSDVETMLRDALRSR